MAEIGLFPLNVVLLPGERLPLHVFEERYKDLIGECLETSKEFGLVRAEKTELRTVGTSAGVVEVLNRYDDGRLDVVVEGRERFKVTRVTEGRPFLTAEIQPYPDDNSEGDAALIGAARHALEELATSTGTDPEALELGDEERAWQIASHVDLGPEFKQELLEMRTENERLVRLIKALADAARVLARNKEIKERAAGNGKVDDL